MSKNNEARVWCADCRKKKPPVIIVAAFLVPVRKGFYSLADNGYEIDDRMIGVCNDCLTYKNKFQRDNKEDVDPSHPNLINKLAW